MTGGKILDTIEMDLRRRRTNEILTVYIDVEDNSLSRKWLAALNQLLADNYHLEKNYCFFGFAEGDRDGRLILDAVNESIAAINDADLGYYINDHFSLDNCLDWSVLGPTIIHNKFNRLHRYFEDLQGQAGKMSPFAQRANPTTKWHIRQLNLLCHEFESWANSYRHLELNDGWQRPSQLMCWLNAPRFLLSTEDYQLFGIDTLNRPLGGVFVGVNKSVGKHHWEVFNDEGRDSRIGELVTSTLITQTVAAGDFDIEWARSTAEFDFQKKALADFREWLVANGFDPEDKNLTIGHPKVAQVDLMRTFGTDDPQTIREMLTTHLDVAEIRTSEAKAAYDYHWSDPDFRDRQIAIIEKGR